MEIDHRLTGAEAGLLVALETLIEHLAFAETLDVSGMIDDMREALAATDGRVPDTPTLEYRYVLESILRSLQTEPLRLMLEKAEREPSPPDAEGAPLGPPRPR